MNDVRFPVMLVRPSEKGSSTITAYDLSELQKTFMNELSVSYGYASMCDALEILGTLKRRGYGVKSVRFAAIEEDEA